MIADRALEAAPVEPLGRHGLRERTQQDLAGVDHDAGEDRRQDEPSPPGSREQAAEEESTGGDQGLVEEAPRLVRQAAPPGRGDAPPAERDEDSSGEPGGASRAVPEHEQDPDRDDDGRAGGRPDTDAVAAAPAREGSDAGAQRRRNRSVDRLGSAASRGRGWLLRGEGRGPR